MMNYAKCWLALAGMAVTLAALVGTASARTFSISNQSFRGTWRSVDFIAPGSATVRCPVTLEGSLHARTMAKVVGTLVGYITRAVFGGATCTGGTAAVLNETLPWQLTYLSFTGTLPRPSRLTVTIRWFGMKITVRLFEIEVTCSYRTGSVNGMFNEEAGGALTSFQLEGRNLAPDQGFPCEPAEVAGTSNTLTLLNTTTRITVTLI